MNDEHMPRGAGADIDLDRRRRCGFPEVIYGEGKQIESILEIVRRLLEADQYVLATRIDAAKGYDFEGTPVP